MVLGAGDLEKEREEIRTEMERQLVGREAAQLG